MAAQYNPDVDEFELQRKRAGQQVGAATQNQQDALKRRFAALGGINSGAAIKQQQLVAQQGEENLAKANEGINAAQNVELRRQKEMGEAREFAKSERLGSQDFAALQADINRKYGTSEREASQGFQAGMARNAQEFAAQQSKLARDLQSSQFDKQFGLAGLQFEEEKRINNANLDLQQRLAGQKDLLERLFGNVGLGGLFSEGGGGGRYGSIVGGALGGSTGAQIGGSLGF